MNTHNFHLRKLQHDSSAALKVRSNHPMREDGCLCINSMIVNLTLSNMKVSPYESVCVSVCMSVCMWLGDMDSEEHKAEGRKPVNLTRCFFHFPPETLLSYPTSFRRKRRVTQAITCTGRWWRNGPPIRVGWTWLGTGRSTTGWTMVRLPLADIHPIEYCDSYFSPTIRSGDSSEEIFR